MRNLNYLILLLLLANSWKSSLNSDSSLCPNYCKCFINRGLRHASCIGQGLSNIDTGVPSNVQILDLSNNTISGLERKAFKTLGLTLLFRLQLQNNHIGTIDLHAFSGVTELLILDLSYNHLYYIKPATFEDTLHLRHLYLQGNRLKFYNGPILIIPTLQILDISNCQIDYLETDTFEELPGLQSLNISHNQLIQLDTQVLEPLENLKIIGLDRNPWSCDGNAAKLETRLKVLNIQHNPICGNKKQGTGDKFQRMISVVTEANQDNDVEIINEDDLIKIWYQNDQDKNANIKNDNHWICNKSDTSVSKTGNIFAIFDRIPSFWCLLIGFEFGCIFGGLFMWVLLRLQETRANTRPGSLSPLLTLQSLPTRTSLVRLRSLGEESAGLCDETDPPNCPGTPPPAYRDLFGTLTRTLRTNSHEN